MVAALVSVAVATDVVSPGGARGQASQSAVGSPAVLTGQVRDEAGVALAGAEVAVVGSGRRVLADGAGRFVIRGLHPGSYRLEAMVPGYAPEVREVEVRGSGEPTPVFFVLRATPLVLPGLVATGAPTGGAALDLTRSATRLSGRALERNLGGTVAETLSGQPGVAVRYNGPGAASPVVRGLTGERVVVMQDGHRTADLAGTAEDHMVTIDPLSARSIEVVRGPAALLYGTNALGGVVNVLTGDMPTHGPSRSELSGAFRLESATGGGTGQVRAAVPLTEAWSLGLRLSGRTADDVRVPGTLPGHSSRLPDSWLRHGSGSASVGYGGPRAVGGATLRFYGFEYGVPMPPEEEESMSLRGRLVSATGRLEADLAHPVVPSVRLAWSATDYAHDELESGDLEMAFALRTAALDVQARQAALGRLAEGAWGVSLSVRDYAATGEDQLAAPARSLAAGVFTYQQLPLTAAVALEVGVRLDRHAIVSREDPHFGPAIARDFTTLSGSAGASIDLGRGVSGALTAARSFRAPTVEELFSQALHAGTASYEIGDPTLSPETMAGVDAVFRVRTDRLAAEVSAYASRIDGFIGFNAPGDTLIDGVSWPVLAYAQQPASMRGVEGSVDWVAARNVVLGVSGDLVRGELAGGAPTPFLPAARLGATARWEPGAFSVGVSTRHAFAQRRVSGGPDVPTEAYTLVDADVGFRLVRGSTGHSLTLTAMNLTDREFRDAASRIKRFAPNPGRNVALLYRVHF
jgi:iron complex outermembrane recepter protein